MTDLTISPLRRRMIEGMTIRKFGARSATAQPMTAWHEKEPRLRKQHPSFVVRSARHLGSGYVREPGDDGGRIGSEGLDYDFKIEDLAQKTQPLALDRPLRRSRIRARRAGVATGGRWASKTGAETAVLHPRAGEPACRAAASPGARSARL